MSDLICCWQKGDARFYTRCFDVAEKAARVGFLVRILKI